MSDLLSRPVAYSGRSSFAARRGLLRELDWVLIAVTAGLTAIGTVLVWSATAPMLEAAGLSTHTYLKKQLLNVALGVVLLVAFSVMDHRRLRAYVPLAYGVSLVLLVGVLASAPVNGAHAWIELPGGFQLEPSEFAKLGLIGAAALILSPRTIGHPRPGLKHVALAVLAALPLIGLVEKEPALGVTLVLVAVLAAMVVVSGIRLYWVVGGALGVAAAVYGVATMHLLHGYQLTRLTSFLHPENDLAGAGYNEIEAKIAVGSGGMFGQGLFHGSLIANNYVPSQETDFIFTVAGEELGFVGCAVIIALLGLLVFRAIRIAMTADDQFGMLVATGIAVWFAFQGFVNIGMTIGIMPITGLPLPFVSYGGSAVFADMIAVGLLQSIHRHRSLFT
ncbi:MAG: FtsW/RodA/SpoVE family cell cycle protein [Streptosporangiaceae bacterium]|jgi:rod shape determining protein RodA